jgi:hypothetical protein
MGIAGLLGALAVLGAELAGNLNTLIAAQFVAGAAWGCMLRRHMALILLGIPLSAAKTHGPTHAQGRPLGAGWPGACPA